MVPPMPPEVSKEIELVKSLVARHFPVYDVRVSYDVIQFFCKADPMTLEDQFEQMRVEMTPQGYVPMIAYEKGEYVVTVAKKPQAKYKSIYLNLGLLIATFAAMLFAGTLEWAGYDDVASGDVFAPETVAMGLLTFTLPLLAVLAVHELGHYFMARRRKVAASLPFFIPSIPPLGTFGAFISLRDPIPNRKALLEIGVAGPLAGLALAIPLTLIGLYLTNLGARPIPQNIGSEGGLMLSLPILYTALEQFVPIQGDYLIHPTAFAAWVGLLVTALNLLPVGQLDGGHVARALLGRKQKYLSWVTVAALIGIGIFYVGWLLFAMLVLFLGARHPPPLNDITGLDLKRKLVGIGAFVVLVVAFIPIPMTAVSADYSFEMSVQGSPEAELYPGDSAEFTVDIENVGNALNDISLSEFSIPTGWSILFKHPQENESAYADTVTLSLNSSESTSANVRITASGFAEPGVNYSVGIMGEAVNSSSDQVVVDFNITIVSPAVDFFVVDDYVDIAAGGDANTTITANNTSPAPTNLTFSTVAPGYLGIVLTSAPVLDPNASSVLNITVDGDSSAEITVWLFAASFAPTGELTIEVSVASGERHIATLNLTVNVA